MPVTEITSQRLANGAWRVPVRFRLLRGSLDVSLRAWWVSQQTDVASWQTIETEVRARTTRRAQRYGLSAEDCEDVVSETFVRLLRLLHGRGADAIRDFDPYVNCIIDNLCKGQIRRDKPVWTRLKGEIIETLRGHRGAAGFALWKVQHEELAGYADWAGRAVEWTERFAALQRDTHALRKYLYLLVPSASELPQLLSAIFNWLGTPLPVNDLTSLVFDLQGLQEREVEPCEMELVADPSKGVDEELLLAIAHAFRELEASDAATFLFHLKPEVAERLLMRLSPDGVAECAIPILAQHLQREQAEVASALDELPWDDLRIASFLCVKHDTLHKTQQAIINMRQRAIRRMRRFLEKLEGE